MDAANDPVQAPPRRRPRWIRPLLMLGSLGLALLLAEGGTRLWLRSQGRPHDGGALIEKLKREADTLVAFTPPGAERNPKLPPKRTLHPFFGAQNEADPGGVQRYFQKNTDETSFEVLVMGGSVAMLFGKDAGKDLAAALQADPALAGRKVRVLNGAHAAYKQPQHLNKLAYLFALGIRPDAVLNLDGFNEVANGLQNGRNGTHPMFPTAPLWGALLWGRGEDSADVAVDSVRLKAVGARYAALVERAETWGLTRSAIGGLWVGRQADGLQAQRQAITESLMGRFKPEALAQKNKTNRELNGEAYDREEAAVMETSVRSWKECSISMEALCRARGVLFLQALQPTLWDPGAKPIAPAEKGLKGAAEWRRGVELGYPLLRAAIPELEQAGIPTLDLSRAFAEVTEPLYFDPCHYHPEGAQMLVPAVHARLVELIEAQ